MKNANASAFPIKDECSGLTKREYFAGLAMQGILSSFSYADATELKSQQISQSAIAYADSLLKQLEP